MTVLEIVHAIGFGISLICNVFLSIFNIDVNTYNNTKQETYQESKSETTVSSAQISMINNANVNIVDNRNMRPDVRFVFTNIPTDKIEIFLYSLQEWQLLKCIITQVSNSYIIFYPVITNGITTNKYVVNNSNYSSNFNTNFNTNITTNYVKHLLSNK